jgi:hypothetical protein
MRAACGDMQFRADSEYDPDVICYLGGCFADRAEHGHAVSDADRGTDHVDRSEPAGDLHGGHGKRDSQIPERNADVLWQSLSPGR